MITCKRAAEWTSLELDVPLPLGRRLALGVHRLLCRACRRFRAQLTEIDRAAGEFLSETDVPVGRLPDSARLRIRQALADETAG